MIILLSVTCAVNAWVYCNILIHPDHILGPLYGWMEKMLTYKTELKSTRPVPPEVAELAARSGVKYESERTIIQVKKSKWLMPLGGCSYCTAGQLCLWSMIVYYLFPGYFPEAFQVLRTAWLLITAICSSILLVKIINVATNRATD